MIFLLFALFHTLHGAPLSSSSSTSLNLEDHYTFLAFRESTSQDSNVRTIWDIVWSCLVTILACTWSAFHPNIPGPYDSGWRNLKRRVVATFYALIAPEIVTLWALIQFIGARSAMKDYNETIAKSKPEKWTIIQCVEEYFLSVPRETNAQGAEPWTMTHAFFAQMGGFLLCDDGKPVQVLTYARLKKCIDDGTIDPPDITEDEIQDRSKGDFISKGLVVLQTSWFVLQCITRWSQKLPLSELEVVTLGFALLNGITYALWWHKPQDVGKAFRVAKKKNTHGPEKKPTGVVDSEKEHADSVEFQEGGFTFQSPTNDSAHIAAKSTTAPDIKLLPTLPVSNNDEKLPPVCEAVESQEGGPTSQTPINDSACIAALVKEPDPEVLPNNDGADFVDDDKKLEPDNVTTGGAPTETGVPPAYKKVKFIRVKLRSDYEGVDGSWSSLLWFWGCVVPIRLIMWSIYAFYKVVNPEPVIEDGALRVPMFGSDALEASSYAFIVYSSPFFGTVFGSVHFLAWWSVFPTRTEQLLWRISTVYATVYPSFTIVALIMAFAVNYLFDFFRLTPTPRNIITTLAGHLFGICTILYGASRLILIFEAILALHDLPAAVYQDVEWTIFIPHL